MTQWDEVIRVKKSDKLENLKRDKSWELLG